MRKSTRYWKYREELRDRYRSILTLLPLEDWSRKLYNKLLIKVEKDLYERKEV